MNTLLTSARAIDDQRTTFAQERKLAEQRAWLDKARAALTDQLTRDFGNAAILVDRSIDEAPRTVKSGFMYFQEVDVILTGPSGQSVIARASRMENSGHVLNSFGVHYEVEVKVLFWTRRKAITALRAAEILG